MMPAWLQGRRPRQFVWRRYTVALRGLSAGWEGARILLLSDLHLRGPMPRAYWPLLDAVDRDEPDLLLIGGDLIHRFDPPGYAVDEVRNVLGRLHARRGCYAVLGNHDHHLPREVWPGHFTLLDGERAEVVGADGGLELIGLPGLRRTALTDAWLRSMPAKQAELPRIVLGHYPDHLPRCAAIEPDLFLAGHTHGGQICLPGGFAAVTHDGLPRRRAAGLHQVGPTTLIVSRGMGVVGIPVRLFCPAEVVEIALRRNA